MIDPYTALGAASAIVQFVQFGATVVSKAYNIHKAADGSILELAELENARSRLEALSAQLDAIAHDQKVDGSLYEKAAAKLAVDCENIANRMLELLRDFDTQGQPGKLKSVQMAIRLERRKPALASLEKELNTLRSEASTFLMKTLCK